jgi:hypothetical protein
VQHSVNKPLCIQTSEETDNLCLSTMRNFINLRNKIVYHHLCLVFMARMGENRNAYMFVVGKPERKRPLGRPVHQLEDNNKIDLR